LPKLELLADKEYAAMGFRSGLEIHQQLDTRQKLFCHCPVGLTDSEPDMQILRHMRPTLSELGEYDGTALMEFRTRKQVVYQLFADRTCTYEMDDTPPFPLNREAVEIAIEIALLLNCRIVDEIHVTRKQYLDGSIPTGFQRTAVVGVEGWIPYKDHRIRVAMLTLEEDACREVSDVGHTITFKTDRLSTPLVEVITYPDLRTPSEVAEVNRLLGDLLRATGKVRRGIGTVRQDVNVSVGGGTRVEIKGVPKIGYHAALTHFEAIRQKALLELKQECERRGLNIDTLKPRRIDVSKLLRRTSCAYIRAALDNGGVVLAVLLPGCTGLFSHEVQPGRSFADEVAGRIRVVACIDRMPNLLHSDDIKGSCLQSGEWKALRKELEAGEGDLIALVFGESLDAKTAAEEVEGRMLEALRGVPNETRQVMPGGLTDFERILPGPDRMYPDTDTPPTAVTADLVEQIKARLPERPWEREERYCSLGLSGPTAHSLSRSPLGELFDKLALTDRTAAREIAHILINSIGHLNNRTGENGIPEFKVWSEILELYTQGRISREAVVDILGLAHSQPERRITQLVDEHELSCSRKEELEATCEAVFKSWQRPDQIGFGAAVRWLVGEIVARTGRRFPGAHIARLVTKRLEEMGISDEKC
jgi:glutamyl-tRNA(Gln) amidotransferase subunit E